MEKEVVDAFKFPTSKLVFLLLTEIYDVSQFSRLFLFLSSFFPIVS